MEWQPIPWEAETYKRLLTLIGGSDEELERARALLGEFNHFFPDAKKIWDDYCTTLGVA